MMCSRWGTTDKESQVSEQDPNLREFVGLNEDLKWSELKDAADTVSELIKTFRSPRIPRMTRSFEHTICINKKAGAKSKAKLSYVLEHNYIDGGWSSE